MLIYKNTVRTESGVSFEHTFFNDVDRQVVVHNSMAMGANLRLTGANPNDILLDTDGNRKHVLYLPAGNITLIVYSGTVATSLIKIRDIRWFDYLWLYWFHRS